MNLYEFKSRIISTVPPGTVLENLGKGQTTFISYDDRIRYKRGNTDNFRISFSDLYSAYYHFLGREVSTSDLKIYRPEIFDSKQNGHSCNCTVFFVLLRESNIITEIYGAGKSGDPFYVKIPEVKEKIDSDHIDHNQKRDLKFILYFIVIVFILGIISSMF